MNDIELHALAARVEGPRLMKHLAAFARWTKHAGTQGELDSLAYVRAELDGYGYATELILHDAYISLPGEASVSIAGETLPAITQSFSRSSPTGGLEGEVIPIGSGSPADFAARDVRGKIVLVEGIATPAVSQRAGRAGAIGQIHLSPSVHAHEMCISPVWGSPTDETAGNLPTTVVVTLAKADGDRLKEKLGAAPGTPVTLNATVDTGWRKTPILVASLDRPDADADEPFVLFSGHHDTWYYGVMDNGGANATMLEVARLSADARNGWQRGLKIFFWSGHSQGRYSSSTWYADTHWEELATRAVAHVNIDSTCAKGNTVLTDVQAAAELVPFSRKVIRAEGEQELFGHRITRAGDQSFWGVGIPAMFSNLGEHPASGAAPAASFLFGGPNKQGAGTGWWWHTPEDTLDKMDEAIAVRDTRVYLHAVAGLLTASILPIDYAAHADMLLAQIDGFAKDLGDRFDLAPLRTRAEGLRTRTEALAAWAAGEHTQEQAGRINACLMAVSRALVPVDYTSGDRFDHDPALAQPAYPSLAALGRLATTSPGSDAEKFANVAARRGVNRVLFALREAHAALDACLADLASGKGA
ncbi:MULTISPECIES: M28 family peptidase [unclassified Chelatococcus]|uniref:M28 family peptidase n=1 Tax=unclassified Chelatococcus TaxID=2638111 RepID=UPI001BCC9FFB|nr:MULTISPECIES: M28 family peptidase [unclassified Chelatococcus]CAH1654237.1 PA domain-containing protein [Hyphomicrobiales bacterium]MBS7740224.1 M28 family peptidase [Chelatococcus sp. HY11]MBX3544947.1 M28 family peptidase [Chelatococcus sp.]MCO5078535.1 M28 family peptidase [Chelatococcus sp.]CAH1685474.1 PA domain-containing protein [Hyphomicrobiales bacterium]